MRKFNVYIIGLLLICCFSCTGDDDNDLTSAEERKGAAIDELRQSLTAPADGWRVNYQPTAGSGIFFMLLNFDEDGTVTIRSDVADNEGEFIEHTIPYRIDNSLGLELILETYGVFHYLFEKDQASFGAEFEFVFAEKDGDNLVFSSKSDLFDQTILVFEQASPGDEALLSTEISENLSQFTSLTPRVFGSTPPIQQVVLHDKNISVFWSIDLSKRMINVNIAAVGTTMAEVNANMNGININHNTGYAFLGGNLVLTSPLSFQLNGETITIHEITLNDFSATGGPSLCALGTTGTPSYAGEIEGTGQVTIQQSLFESSGLAFQPMAGIPYTVNVPFIFDENGNSLAEGGIISDKFPTASGFIFSYGFNSAEIPPYAVGFFVVDASGVTQIYLREFEPTTTEGNKIAVTLTNNFYYSAPPEAADEQSLIEITDTIFEGGNVYAYEAPALGAGVFRLYNPCNQYEIFLVQ